MLLFGSRKEQPHTYNGARTVDAVTSFVFEQMKSLVERRQNPSAKSSGSHTEAPKTEQKKEENGSKDDKDVTVLTDATFDSTVGHSNSLWLVEFYGKDACGDSVDSPLVRTLQESPAPVERRSL